MHGARLATEPEGRRGDARRVAATQLGAYLVRDADGQWQLPERVLDHGIGFASTYVSHVSGASAAAVVATTSGSYGGADTRDRTAATSVCPLVNTTSSDPTRPETSAVLVGAGPYEWRGYCFYLTTPGSTCDASCSSIGGANLIESALFVFDSGVRLMAATLQQQRSHMC